MCWITYVKRLHMLMESTVITLRFTKALHMGFKSLSANSSRRRRTATDKMVSMKNMEKPETQEDFIESRFQENQ